MRAAPPDRLYLSPPHPSGREREWLDRAIASRYLAPVGPFVDEFERRFAARFGFPDALAVSSGTAAVQLALRGLGVGPGDTVFCATLTFVGSVAPAVQLGATPVFLDSDEATWCLDPDLLAAALRDAAGAGRLPKAVIAVDLYGQCCDYDRLRAACAPYGVPLLGDAAEAVGASYRGRPAGQPADVAVYSFNGNKIITTSGGGMLAAPDAARVARARHLANQARDPAPHYEHSELGYNHRLSNLLAAVGCAQLDALEERVAAKRAIFAQYRERLSGLPGVGFMPEAPGGDAGHARGSAPGARGREHRGAAALEAHAPATGIRGQPRDRRRRQRVALPAWPLPAVRHGDDGRGRGARVRRDRGLPAPRRPHGRLILT
jgi:pyridoxal phosphate-dependent aminotransferase EpsN